MSSKFNTYNPVKSYGSELKDLVVNAGKRKTVSKSRKKKKLTAFLVSGIFLCIALLSFFFFNHGNEENSSEEKKIYKNSIAEYSEADKITAASALNVSVDILRAVYNKNDSELQNFFPERFPPMQKKIVSDKICSIDKLVLYKPRKVYEKKLKNTKVLKVLCCMPESEKKLYLKLNIKESEPELVNIINN